MTGSKNLIVVSIDTLVGLFQDRKPCRCLNCDLPCTIGVLKSDKNRNICHACQSDIHRTMLNV
jgi:hypothetical protein